MPALRPSRCDSAQGLWFVFPSAGSSGLFAFLVSGSFVLSRGRKELRHQVCRVVTAALRPPSRTTGQARPLAQQTSRLLPFFCPAILSMRLPFQGDLLAQDGCWHTGHCISILGEKWKEGMMGSNTPWALSVCLSRDCLGGFPCYIASLTPTAVMLGMWAPRKKWGEGERSRSGVVLILAHPSTPHPSTGAPFSSLSHAGPAAGSPIRAGVPLVVGAALE